MCRPPLPDTMLACCSAPVSSPQGEGRAGLASPQHLPPPRCAHLPVASLPALARRPVLHRMRRRHLRRCKEALATASSTSLRRPGWPAWAAVWTVCLRACCRASSGALTSTSTTTTDPAFSSHVTLSLGRAFLQGDRGRSASQSPCAYRQFPGFP